MLQISLGLLVREKKMIECLHEFGVTSSYDEVRRFKISAAKHASKEDKPLDSKNVAWFKAHLIILMQAYRLRTA